MHRDALSVDSQLFQRLNLYPAHRPAPLFQLFLRLPRSRSSIFLRFRLICNQQPSFVMATYAAYRHIELDKVGYGKKRVRNPSSEIFKVMCSPTDSSPKLNGHHQNTPRKSLHNNDSFTKLFGSPDAKKPNPRRGSLTKQDVTNRNPVTGNGVMSWDCKVTKTPKIYNERNPVTGENYTIISPASTPTKPLSNGFTNGTSTPMQNGNATPLTNGNGTHTPNGNI